MVRRSFLRLFVCLLACGFLQALSAAPMPGITPQELFPWATFDPEIPTQKEAIGFHPGARPLRHAEIMRYLRALADASPRATMTTYAHSYEGRELVYFAVSEADTIAGLDAFREAHAARVDPRGRPAGDDGALLAQAKAVAWMAYGIHGDELSSCDAAAALAYWLVAGEDARAEKLRRELVILIDPTENPDGRDRYLAQTAAFAHAVPNPDTEDLSHTTVWPWGRGNHYLFDLNRDWFSMVHPESRRSAVIASWDPQLMVDSHEMGADTTYLFPPPRHPFNPHLPPHHQEWTLRFSRDQARALDERGYPYFTREWNEEFFPGYGSSWASYRGAIGILYEMSGTSGTLVRKHSGEMRTYAQATEHQVTSSVANLQSLADHREAVLNDFVADRRAAMARAAAGPVAAWVLPEGRYPGRTRRLVELLRLQGIEVFHRGTAKIEGMIDGRTGEAVEASSLTGEAWVVPLDQPAAPLARVLLDPHIPMDARFFREEREYLERGKGTRLYEVTAWSLPLAYDVEAYWTSKRPGLGSPQAVEEPSSSPGFMDTPGAVGYLIRTVADNSMPALAELLEQEIAVRVAEKPFRIEERDYERGTLLVPREGNSEDLAQRLEGLAREFSIEVRAVSTALAQDGPDLGGSHFWPLVAPRVGIWTGSSVSTSDYGALWHLMDHGLEMRFTGLDLSSFNRVDLARYNVLVFPPGRYAAELGKSGISRLKRWIEAGGTAIGIGSGADFLALADNGLTRTRLRREALEEHPPVVLGTTALEAQAAGPFWATGIRAPEQDKKADEAEGKKEKKATQPPVHRESPYDVAPLLGRGALPFAAGVDQGTAAGNPPIDLAEWIRPLLPAGKSKPEAEDLDRADARLRSFSPRGAFVRVELDPEHWLTWGLDPDLPVLARARDTLVARPPVQVAARFAAVEQLHLGGLLWPEAAGRMAHTAYATREGLGRGQVILFLHSPEFRGWTLGTRRLLLNAMLLGPGAGTKWSTPW